MAQADLIAPPTLRMAVAKPKFGIYDALLIIAFFAMLTACLILYLEIRRFGGFGTVKGKVAATERAVPTLVVEAQTLAVAFRA